MVGAKKDSAQVLPHTKTCFQLFKKHLTLEKICYSFVVALLARFRCCAEPRIHTHRFPGALCWVADALLGFKNAHARGTWVRG